MNAYRKAKMEAERYYSNQERPLVTDAALGRCVHGALSGFCTRCQDPA